MIPPQKRRKRAKSKRFSQYQAQTDARIQLFTLPDEEANYSYSIELYDFIPKYYWGKAKRAEGRLLDPLRRDFECRGRQFQLTLVPARIEVSANEFKDYFPGRREELIENALRKLMAEGQGLMLDGEASVTFTIYQIQKELKEKGHAASRDQIKHALEVLYGTDIYLLSADREVNLAFSPIETLGFSGKDNETQTFARFSPLVTASIKQMSFRLFNYDKVMSYKTVIARQLHKRMAHHFAQAGHAATYEILLSAMVRDFGLTPQPRIQENIKEAKKALTEMCAKNVILNGVAYPILGGQPRLVDVNFIIHPHPEFSKEAKKADSRAEELRNRSFGSSRFVQK